MDCFRSTHTLIDHMHPQRRRTVCTKEVVGAVKHSVEEEPNESIWQQLIQFVQELKHHVRSTNGPKTRLFNPNPAILLVRVAIQPKKSLISKQNHDVHKKILMMKPLLRKDYNHKKSLFAVLYRLMEWLGHISSKMMQARTLQSTKSGMDSWL